ncbi:MULTISPECIES: hypothetical protein [Cupriavidus]
MHYARILAAACLLLGPALASAQPGGVAAGTSAAISAPTSAPTSAPIPAHAATPGDPLDPGAAVPPLPSPDVLAGYLPFQAQPVAPWRQTNAEVAPAAAGNPAPASPGHASNAVDGGATAPAAGGHAQHH